LSFFFLSYFPVFLSFLSFPFFPSEMSSFLASSTTGVKGSDVYSTTGNFLLDLNIKCVRGVDKTVLQNAMKDVLSVRTTETVVDAFVTAFHTRNIRGGKGERLVFYNLFQTLGAAYPEMAIELLDLVPHYGCWNDLFVLAHHVKHDTPAESAAARMRNAILDLTAKQLMEDSTNTTGKQSLAAKWAPREDSEYKGLARELAQRLFPTVTQYSTQMRRYRQFVADLNRRLKTVETYMCAGRWDEIEPSSVPGRAGKLYVKAFLNEPSTYRPKGVTAVKEGLRRPDDETRMACRTHFQEHYAKAARGEAKVHGADTLFPHEVVKKAARGEMLESEKDHLRGVWRGMVEKVKAGGGLGRSIFMSDFSGSMQSTTTGDTPYWVSMALGLLGAEVCADEFKDRLMTFDSDPTWHHFRPGSDLFDRILDIELTRCGQGTSTDFQKAMDLVLQTLKEKRCRPGQEPENLIVLTDMGWDQACSSSDVSQYTGHRYRNVVKTAPWQTQVEMIQEAFKRAGEDMWGPGQGFTAPRIVIWNLDANPQTDFHATADTPGVAMLSGWSATQFEILQKEGPRQLTAYEMLRLELDDPKYERIRQRLRSLFERNWREGCL
jgi:hypothetical protein